MSAFHNIYHDSGATVRPLLTKKWVILTAIGLFIANALLSWDRVPFAYRDEAAYLLNAAGLNGWETSFRNYYGIGYSIIIAPIYRIFQEPQSIFFAALVSNAALVAMTFYILFIFSGLWTRKIPVNTWFSASVAMMSPWLWIYSKHAVPEILLALLYASVVFCLWQALVRRRAADTPIWYWVVFAAGSAFLPLAHVRSAPVLLFSIMVIAACVRIGHLRGRRAGALLLLQACILAVGFMLAGYARSNLNAGTIQPVDVYARLGQEIINLLKAKPLIWVFRFVGAAAGQLFYAIAATYCLWFIGAMKAGHVCFRSLRTSGKARSLIFYGFLLSTFFGILAVSAAQKVIVTLPDQFIFGRYIEPFTLPFIVLAVSTILDPKKVHNAGWMYILGACVLSILVIIVMRMRADEILIRQAAPIRTWTITGLAHIAIMTGSLDLRMLGVIAVASSLLIAALMQLNRKVALIVVGGALSLQSILALEVISHRRSEAVKNQNLISQTIRQRSDLIPVGTCINYDVASRNWHFSNNAFKLYDYRIEFAEIEKAGAKLCSAVVVTSRNNLLAFFPSACLLAKEHDVDLYLWYVGTIDPGERRRVCSPTS